MGGFGVFTDTQFIGADELGAVSSYQPCHLFGDPMLIGLGIRLSFYLLYFAAIIAVLFGTNKQFRFWHGSWSAVALATLIALCLESTHPSGNPLLVVDWSLLVQLVLWYPVFWVFLTLNWRVYGVGRGGEKGEAEVRARLEKCKREAVTAVDVARTRAYVDVLKAFAAHAAAEREEDDYIAAQAALERSMQVYVATFQERERIEIVDGSNRRVEEVDTDASFLTRVYNPAAIAAVCNAPTRTDVELFRENYVAALVAAEHSAAEARAAEKEAAAIFAEETALKRRKMRPRHAVRYLVFDVVTKDRLAAALGLLVWAGYFLATPWLFKNGYRHGSKPECDGDVKLLLALAPISPFTNPGFRTFLIIFSAGSVVVAVIAIAAAVFIVLAGLLNPRKRKARRHQSEANDDLVQDVPRSHHSHRARRREADEILTCLHTAPAQESRGRYEKTVVGRPTHFSLSNIPWAILLTILLVETMITVELTVTIDHLDFVLAPLHETAEILATLIGILAIVLVLWSVVSGLLVARVYKRKGKASGSKRRGGKRKDESRENSLEAKERGTHAY